MRGASSVRGASSAHGASSVQSASAVHGASIIHGTSVRGASSPRGASSIHITSYARGAVSDCSASIRETSSIQVASNVGGASSPLKGMVPRKVLSFLILRPHIGVRDIFSVISNQQQHYEETHGLCKASDLCSHQFHRYSGSCLPRAQRKRCNPSCS